MSFWFTLRIEAGKERKMVLSRRKMRTVKVLVILGFVLFLVSVLEAEPVGTEFTYQGRAFFV